MSQRLHKEQKDAKRRRGKEKRFMWLRGTPTTIIQLIYFVRMRKLSSVVVLKQRTTSKLSERMWYEHKNKFQWQRNEHCTQMKERDRKCVCVVRWRELQFANDCTLCGHVCMCV